MKSLSMRRNICDLDLCLASPSANYYYDLSHTTTTSSPAAETMEGGRGGGSSGTAGSGSPQPLTIIFNGKVCVSDVTELQARAILYHAARRTEMDETMNNITPATTPVPCSSSLPPSPSGPSLLLQTPPTTTTAMNLNDISMKRSLQRFLQKRKNRIQSISSPYNKQ